MKASVTVLVGAVVVSMAASAAAIDLKKILKAVANPVGAVHEELSKKVPALAPLSNVVQSLANPAGAVAEEAAKKVAPAVGLDPKVAPTIVNPLGTAVDQAPKALETAVGIEVKHFTKLVEAIQTGRLDKAVVNELNAGLSRSLNPGGVNALQPLLSKWTVPPGLHGGMLERPDVIFINRDRYPGAMVYYVNGMDTSKDSARVEAEALSRRLSRPVGLIYNATDGAARDVLEAAYDRLWPFFPLAPASLQVNSTTRQVAHVLYHAEQPVSVVSHSQGCLIVRNALLIANHGSAGKAKDRVAWTATGMPMRTEEIYPAPARFRAICNADDTVPQAIGLQLNPDEFFSQNARRAHDFVAAYVSQIRMEDVY